MLIRQVRHNRQHPKEAPLNNYQQSTLGELGKCSGRAKLSYSGAIFLKGCAIQTVGEWKGFGHKWRSNANFATQPSISSPPFIKTPTSIPQDLCSSSI